MTQTVLIMAGGRGERVWPLSRENRPKQFLSIASEKTLLEQTVERALMLTNIENIFIVTGEVYRDLFDIYMPDFNKENIIFEPVAKNTAAAICLGAYHISQKIENSIITIIPSDPIIKNENLFCATLRVAQKFAEDNVAPVIIGIKPSRAETGYGYIHTKSILSQNEEVNVYSVDSFKEKPNRETANLFLKDGRYLWNSGMFIWNNNYLLSTIEKLMPKMYENVLRCFLEQCQNNKTEALKSFEQIEKISFDYGIMERVANTICVKGDFFWDDLGVFSSLGRIYEADVNDNIALGNVCIHDCKNAIVLNNSNESLIVASGLSNVTVVQSDGVVIIYPSGEDERVKEMLALVKGRENDKRHL